MRILGRAGERGPFRWGRPLLEPAAEIAPGRREALAGAREQRIGELAGAEADEVGQDLLLVGRRRAVLRI